MRLNAYEARPRVVPAGEGAAWHALCMACRINTERCQQVARKAGGPWQRYTRMCMYMCMCMCGFLALICSRQLPMPGARCCTRTHRHPVLPALLPAALRTDRPGCPGEPPAAHDRQAALTARPVQQSLASSCHHLHAMQAWKAPLTVSVHAHAGAHICPAPR